MLSQFLFFSQSVGRHTLGGIAERVFVLFSAELRRNLQGSHYRYVQIFVFLYLVFIHGLFERFSLLINFVQMKMLMEKTEDFL